MKLLNLKNYILIYYFNKNCDTKMLLSHIFISYIATKGSIQLIK